MWTSILYTSCVFTICASQDFSIWNHCQQSTACTLPLGSARYAYGSGYESGSDNWYLIGGTGQTAPSNPFVTVDTTAIIKLPSVSGQLTGVQCSSIYNSNLPQPFGQSVGAVINDELYSFGGFNNQYVYLHDIYQSNSSTQSAFGSASCSLPINSSAACSVTIASKVYIIGGLLDGGITSGVYVVDFSIDPCTVTELANMIHPRFAPACSSNGDKIFVFGGQTVGGQYGFGDDLNSTEIYSIITNSWSLSNAQLSYKAHWSNAAYFNILNRNLSLIMGGSMGYPVTVYDNLDVYDMDNDTIIDRDHLREGRYAFNSITLSHNNWESRFVMIAGGKNGDGEAVSDVDVIHCNSTATTSEPTTSEPTTSEPTTSEPTTSEPTVSMTEPSVDDISVAVQSQTFMSVAFVLLLLTIN